MKSVSLEISTLPFFPFVQTKITLASVFQSADYTLGDVAVRARGEPIFIFGRASIIRIGLCYKKNGVIS